MIFVQIKKVKFLEKCITQSKPFMLATLWHPTPVLLPGKSHGRRSLVGYSPCGLEESDRTEQLHFHFHFHMPKNCNIYPG